MTVADMEARMSNAEFIGWYTYYAKQGQAQELEMLKARGGSHHG
jgi:hypothetical protein